MGNPDDPEQREVPFKNLVFQPTEEPINEGKEEVDKGALETRQKIFQTDGNKLDLEIIEIKSKISLRRSYATIFTGILMAQNVAVYGLVYRAYFDGSLDALQGILATLIAGTLAETYFAVRTIFKWMYQDIDYKLRSRE